MNVVYAIGVLFVCIIVGVAVIGFISRSRYQENPMSDGHNN